MKPTAPESSWVSRAARFVLRSWAWCLIGAGLGAFICIAIQLLGVSQHLPFLDSVLLWPPVVRFTGYLAGGLGILVGSLVCFQIMEETGCVTMCVLWTLGLGWIIFGVPLIAGYLVTIYFGKIIASGLVGSAAGAGIGFAFYGFSRKFRGHEPVKQSV